MSCSLYGGDIYANLSGQGLNTIRYSTNGLVSTLAKKVQGKLRFS